MSYTTAGDDVTREAPADVVGDPFDSLSSQIESLESLLRMVFEDYDEFVEDLVEDVLSQPPQQRFTHAHETAREHLEEEFSTLGAFQSQVASLSPDQVSGFIQRLNQHLLDEILRGVYFERDAETRILLAALVQTVDGVVRALKDADTEETKQLIGSVLLSLWLRLVQAARQDTPRNQKELIRDVARAQYYLAQATGEDETMQNPDNRPFSEVQQDVREYGAAVAYAHLDISLGRGAELAGISQHEFKEQVLPAFDVESRSGPESAVDLSEGTDCL